MAPPLFADFSKNVSDILSDDFGDKKFLKAKTSTPAVMTGKVGVTSETSLSNFAGKLSAKWKHKCGFSLDKVAFDAKGAKYEASMSKLAKGLVVKATGKLNMSSPLDTVGLEFQDDMVAAACKTDTKFSGAQASLVLGHDGVQVGGSLVFKKDDGVSDYPLAIGYGDQAFFVAASAEDKLRKFGIAGKYVLSDELTLALCGSSGLEFSKGSPNKLELGAAYKVNGTTTAKCKYAFVDGQKSGNNPGSLEAAVNASPLKAVNLVCGLAIPLSDVASVGSYKYGAGITLG